MGFLLVRKGGAWRRLSPIAGYAFLGGLVRRAIATPHFFTKKRRHLKEDAFVFSYLSGGSPAYSLAKSEKFSMI